MKKLFLVTILMLVASNFAFAQLTSMQIKLTNSDNEHFTNLYIGISPDASEGIDLSLGENYLPGHPPMNDDLHAYMYFEFGNEGARSYKDYRPEQDIEFFSYDYTINLRNATSDIKIKIDEFPQNVESIFIRTKYIAEEEAIELKPGEYVEIESEYYSKNILVKVNYGATTSISNDNEEEVKVYPNPCDDYLVVKTDNYDSFTIYDLLGNTVRKGYFVSDTIDMTSLNRGAYYIALENATEKKVVSITKK